MLICDNALFVSRKEIFTRYLDFIRSYSIVFSAHVIRRYNYMILLFSIRWVLSSKGSFIRSKDERAVPSETLLVANNAYL